MLPLKISTTVCIAFALAGSGDASAQESNFRCIGASCTANGMDITISYNALSEKQTVQFLLFSTLPDPDDVRLHAKPTTSADWSVRLHNRTWKAGIGKDTIHVKAKDLTKIGAKPGDTVYLAGYWPKWSHVWGYKSPGREVPVTIPAGVKNSRIRSIGPRRTLRRSYSRSHFSR